MLEPKLKNHLDNEEKIHRFIFSNKNFMRYVNWRLFKQFCKVGGVDLLVPGNYVMH